MRAYLLFLSVAIARICPILSVCPRGRYGRDCRQTCGRCVDQSACHPSSGLCPGKCVSGWRPPLCQLSFPVLRNPPTLRNRSSESLMVAWKRWTNVTDDGVGTPAIYLLQLKTATESQWNTVSKLKAHRWSEKDDGFEVILSIRRDVAHRVRVVVVDESGERQENAVPSLYIDGIAGLEKNETGRRRNEWKTEFTWLGVIAFSGFVVAVTAVIAIECVKRFRRRRQKGTDAVPMAIYQNGPEGGVDNEAYATVRATSGGVDDGAEKDEAYDAYDARHIDFRGRGHFLRVLPEETTRGFSSRTDHGQVESWSTDWLDSRIYENETGVKINFSNTPSK